jgi:circadian clock protein KaiB
MKTSIVKYQVEPNSCAVDSVLDTKQERGDQARDRTYVLRLFVAGDKPQSLEAKKNIEQICAAHLQGRYELSVFDVCNDFITALDHGVLLTPTLLLLSPLPRVTIIGNLSDTEKVLGALRLPKANHE